MQLRPIFVSNTSEPGNINTPSPTSTRDFVISRSMTLSQIPRGRFSQAPPKTRGAENHRQTGHETRIEGIGCNQRDVARKDKGNKKRAPDGEPKAALKRLSGQDLKSRRRADRNPGIGQLFHSGRHARLQVAAL